jgi:hypothetical protein
MLKRVVAIRLIDRLAHRPVTDAAGAARFEGDRGQRKADPYRPETLWYKIKSRTYTQGNGRWELFQRR